MQHVRAARPSGPLQAPHPVIAPSNGRRCWPKPPHAGCRAAPCEPPASATGDPGHDGRSEGRGKEEVRHPPLSRDASCPPGHWPVCQPCGVATHGVPRGRERIPGRAQAQSRSHLRAADGRTVSSPRACCQPDRRIRSRDVAPACAADVPSASASSLLFLCLLGAARTVEGVTSTPRSVTQQAAPAQPAQIARRRAPSRALRSRPRGTTCPPLVVLDAPPRASWRSVLSRPRLPRRPAQRTPAQRTPAQRVPAPRAPAQKAPAQRWELSRPFVIRTDRSRNAGSRTPGRLS